MQRIFFFLLLFVATVRANAQDKPLEYFAKVPTRFEKPGLSPMQSIRFGFIGTPGNQWVKQSGELKLDLIRVRLSKRASAIISASAWAGYKRQSRDLYKIRDEQAFERTNYFFAAPAISAGLSYGFFFPYYLNARFGVYKPWEAAYYKALLPIQYSDGQGIQTLENSIEYAQQDFGGIHKYVALELYRPFKSRSMSMHPMGFSMGYTYFLDVESDSQGDWNFGLYWHIKAK